MPDLTRADQILRAYRDDGATLDHLAAQWSITVEHVRQIILKHSAPGEIVPGFHGPEPKPETLSRDFRWDAEPSIRPYPADEGRGQEGPEHGIGGA